MLKSKEICGISIIESMVCIVIIGIGFIAILQLSAFSIGSMDRATEKNKLNYLSEMVMEDMIGDPDNISNYANFNETCSYGTTGGSDLYDKQKNKLNYLSEMVMEDMIGDPDNAAKYGNFSETCNYTPKGGTGLDKKMKDKWRDKLKEKNHIRINNKEKKLPCDNADTKKTFIDSGTNTTGRVNFLSGKGKRKKYLGVVVK